MKIIAPVESKSLDVNISSFFGRSPFFVLYDTQNDSYEFIDNSAVASLGGAGTKAAQVLVDSGANALITYSCGENAARVLNAADITIYKAEEGSVKDNIAKYKSGELSLLDDIHPGFHGKKR